jgi:hypothetical protein
MQLIRILAYFLLVLVFLHTSFTADIGAPSSVPSDSGQPLVVPTGSQPSSSAINDLVSPELCYQSYHRDILHPVKRISGTWKKHSLYSNLGHFSDKSNLDAFWESACPVQSRVFSCRRKDLRPSPGNHGYDVMTQRFSPDFCELKEFSSIDFLSVLRNRRLGVTGDSISMQFATMMICSLSSAFIKAKYHIIWDDLYPLFGQADCKKGVEGKFCHFQGGTVSYPEYNATITFFPEWMHSQRPLELSLWLSQFTSHDILLFNFGLHIHQSIEVIPRIEAFFKVLNQSFPSSSLIPDTTSSRQHPILIWRETSSQHFDSSGSPEIPPGYYSKDRNAACVPYTNVTVAHQEDYRNTIANAYLEKLSIPIMRISEGTALAHDQHVGLQSRTDQKERYDCTHYCDSSGVFYYFREIFFNILPIILDFHNRPNKKDSSLVK